MVPATQAASRLMMNSKPSLEMRVTKGEVEAAIWWWWWWWCCGGCALKFGEENGNVDLVISLILRLQDF